MISSTSILLHTIPAVNMVLLSGYEDVSIWKNPVRAVYISIFETLFDYVGTAMEEIFAEILFAIPKLETEGAFPFGRPETSPLPGDTLTLLSEGLFPYMAANMYEYVWVPEGGILTIVGLLLFIGGTQFNAIREALLFQRVSREKGKTPISGLLLILFWFPLFFGLIGLIHGLMYSFIDFTFVGEFSTFLAGSFFGGAIISGGNPVVLGIGILTALPYFLIGVIMQLRAIALSMYLGFGPILIGVAFANIPVISKAAYRLLLASIPFALIPIPMAPVLFLISEFIWGPIFPPAGVIGISDALILFLLGYMLLLFLVIVFFMVSPRVAKAGGTLGKLGTAGGILAVGGGGGAAYSAIQGGALAGLLRGGMEEMNNRGGFGVENGTQTFSRQSFARRFASWGDPESTSYARQAWNRYGGGSTSSGGPGGGGGSSHTSTSSSSGGGGSTGSSSTSDSTSSSGGHGDGETGETTTSSGGTSRSSRGRTAGRGTTASQTPHGRGYPEITSSLSNQELIDKLYENPDAFEMGQWSEKPIVNGEYVNEVTEEIIDEVGISSEESGEQQLEQFRTGVRQRLGGRSELNPDAERMVSPAENMILYRGSQAVEGMETPDVVGDLPEHTPTDTFVGDNGGRYNPDQQKRRSDATEQNRVILNQSAVSGDSDEVVRLSAAKIEEYADKAREEDISRSELKGFIKRMMRQEGMFNDIPENEISAQAQPVRYAVAQRYNEKYPEGRSMRETSSDGVFEIVGEAKTADEPAVVDGANGETLTTTSDDLKSNYADQDPYTQSPEGGTVEYSGEIVKTPYKKEEGHQSVGFGQGLAGTGVHADTTNDIVEVDSNVYLNDTGDDAIGTFNLEDASSDGRFTKLLQNDVGVAVDLGIDGEGDSGEMYRISGLEYEFGEEVDTLKLTDETQIEPVDRDTAALRYGDDVKGTQTEGASRDSPNNESTTGEREREHEFDQDEFDDGEMENESHSDERKTGSLGDNDDRLDPKSDEVDINKPEEINTTDLTEATEAEGFTETDSRKDKDTQTEGGRESHIDFESKKAEIESWGEGERNGGLSGPSNTGHHSELYSYYTDMTKTAVDIGAGLSESRRADVAVVGEGMAERAPDRQEELDSISSTKRMMDHAAATESGARMPSGNWDSSIESEDVAEFVSQDIERREEMLESLEDDIADLRVDAAESEHFEGARQRLANEIEESYDIEDDGEDNINRKTSDAEKFIYYTALRDLGDSDEWEDVNNTPIF